MVDIGEDAAVRRLWDRFAFGQGGDALATAQADGLERTVQDLLSRSGDRGRSGKLSLTRGSLNLPYLPFPKGVNGKEPTKRALEKWSLARRKQELKLLIWWLDRMVTAPDQSRERLTWFWHGHFATSSRKVNHTRLMLTQNQAFRRHGLGNFGVLAHELIVDPAMLLWLDGNDNTAEAPNENLSREFMELFTLGPGHYSENDIREAARALTGWKVDRETGEAVLRGREHDSSTKQILGQTGNFTASTFVDVLLASDASAEFVVSRLWFRLVSARPPEAEVLGRLVQAYGPRRNIAATLRAITAEPGFRDSSASLVKQPLEWAVGLFRALDVVPSTLSSAQQKSLVGRLTAMGQVPFRPPSVGGWPSGAAWLTTAAGVSRIRLAQQLAAAAPAKLKSKLAKSGSRTRHEQLRRVLGVDQFSVRTRHAISAVADWPNAAFVVAACSPEYVVSR